MYQTITSENLEIKLMLFYYSIVYDNYKYKKTLFPTGRTSF